MIETEQTAHNYLVRLKPDWGNPVIVTGEHLVTAAANYTLLMIKLAQKQREEVPATEIQEWVVELYHQLTLPSTEKELTVPTVFTYMTSVNHTMTEEDLDMYIGRFEGDETDIQGLVKETILKLAEGDENTD